MNPPRPNGTLLYRVEQLEKLLTSEREKNDKLSDRIDKLTLAIVGFALTLAVFGLGIAVTLLTGNA